MSRDSLGEKLVNGRIMDFLKFVLIICKFLKQTTVDKTWWGVQIHNWLFEKRGAIILKHMMNTQV